MILVQEDQRGPRGAGLGQGKLRGGRQRIGLLCGDPLLPRQRPAAGLDEDLPDHGDRGVAAMAMQFDRLGRAAADDDFLTRFHAESPDGQSPVGLGLEPSSAAGVEVCGDRKQGPRPFDQQTCHRPAPGGVNKISLGNFFSGMSASLRIWYPHRAGIRRVRGPGP